MDTSYLSQLEKAHLLVAGEVGIDEYVWGDTRRISPEAPVPVIEVESQTEKLGLTANVAQNIASLGGKVTLVTIGGDDRDGERLSTMLKDAGISRVEILTDPSRPTPRKMRIIAQKQHVVRVDYERAHSLDEKLAKRFRETICDQIPAVDGVIVEDYGKGIWGLSTMEFLKHAQAHRKPVFVDPSRVAPLSLYQGVTLLTPNLAEAEILCGYSGRSSRALGGDDRHLQALGRKLLAATGAEHAVITCGEYGMVAASSDWGDVLTRIPTFAREVFDVTGAGDTVIAVLGMAYVSGQPLARCMQVANAAAGIVVGQIGAATVTLPELKSELERLASVGLIKES